VIVTANIMSSSKDPGARELFFAMCMVRMPNLYPQQKCGDLVVGTPRSIASGHNSGLEFGLPVRYMCISPTGLVHYNTTR
jgi:hypothetical protein